MLTSDFKILFLQTLKNVRQCSQNLDLNPTLETIFVLFFIDQLSIHSSASRTYMQATTVPLRIVAHDATDVPIYATGAMAHLFHTTHEQHYIFHAITYAACLGKWYEVQWRIQDFPEEAPASKEEGTNLLFGLKFLKTAWK